MMCQRIGWDPIGTIGLDGEELVLNPFNRLIKDRQLLAYKYEGFWRAMDMLKDRQVFEEMVERGEMPWRPSWNEKHSRG